MVFRNSLEIKSLLKSHTEHTDMYDTPVSTVVAQIRGDYTHAHSRTLVSKSSASEQLAKSMLLREQHLAHSSHHPNILPHTHSCGSYRVGCVGVHDGECAFEGVRNSRNLGLKNMAKSLSQLYHNQL